jgi:hypothetical protein
MEEFISKLDEMERTRKEEEDHMRGEEIELREEA